MSWLPRARTLAPLEGWKVAGEVEEVPAVVVGEPEAGAEALPAGVVELPTGYGAAGADGVVAGVVAKVVAGVEAGVVAGVEAALVAEVAGVLEAVPADRDELPEDAPPTHWTA